LWDNVEIQGTAGQATVHNIILRIRFAFWINKATDTHSVCVILTAFPLQHWLRKRASILRDSALPVLLTVKSVTANFYDIIMCLDRHCAVTHSYSKVPGTGGAC
jgi:hypothetical protein